MWDVRYCRVLLMESSQYTEENVQLWSPKNQGTRKQNILLPVYSRLEQPPKQNQGKQKPNHFQKEAEKALATHSCRQSWRYLCTDYNTRHMYEYAYMYN